MGCAVGEAWLWEVQRCFGRLKEGKRKRFGSDSRFLRYLAAKSPVLIRMKRSEMRYCESCCDIASAARFAVVWRVG
jgi:hypothetical protein